MFLSKIFNSIGLPQQINLKSGFKLLDNHFLSNQSQIEMQKIKI